VSILRAGLLAGIRVAVAGEAPAELGRRLEQLGAELARPADALVLCTAGEFAAGGRPALSAVLGEAWAPVQEFAAALIERGAPGKVVLVAPAADAGPLAGAARAALENLARTLSVEWARFGVLINAIAVGQIATEALLSKYPRPFVEGIAGSIPLQRMGQPDHVAWLVAYLASPAGDFLSGAVITVDGARDNWDGSWPPPALRDEHGQPLAEQRRPR